VVVLLVVLMAPASAFAAPKPPPPPPQPGAWILVDADTGNVIDASNDHVPMRPASLTKVITALTADALLTPDTPIPVSARAQSMPAHNLNMKAGQVWTYTDALHALLLSSANDAAVALAEAAAGSVESFQQRFAATATALSMADNPVLMDPAGLDDRESVGGGNLVSARDLAIAARALLATPDLADAVSTRIYRFHGVDNVDHRLVNHNRLLVTYPGAIGMKTGYTAKAENCLIAAAKRDGRTMISVVLHVNGTSYNPSTALLDKGFSTPVTAENVADQLPPVPKDLRDALSGKAQNELQITGTPNPNGSNEVAAGALPSAVRAPTSPDTLGTIANAATAPPVVVIELGIAVFLILRLRARRRASRRRRARAKARAAALTRD
jgi:D-alanyl-D-alanine carboxypeptidase (penicillin-binding protein 5/6)